ncbi:MAG: dihydrodipicolinate synthase family protein [Sneathiellaceae bacterium]
MQWTDIDPALRTAFRNGMVIPAHPLALNADRELDLRRQKALSRYYVDAGAGGLAVGVHTTQFAIREAGLYRPVLETAAETVAGWAKRPVLMVAGVVGPTAQAKAEAETAKALGYHAAMVGLAALREASDDELVEHCREVAKVMPIVGFNLQKAVGGQRLSRDFWRKLCGIENLAGIKMAPFNRYATQDVVRGLVAAGAEDRVTLYTGNDDHIVLDLVSLYRIRRGDEKVEVGIAGGLLGHWSVWTRGAVEVLDRCRAARMAGRLDRDMLALEAAVTDMNAAVFDSANDFLGVIAGCHEVLRRQGLLEGRWCLDPAEDLGPGQMAEIDRVCAEYPGLVDDAFVARNLDRWLS